MARIMSSKSLSQKRFYTIQLEKRFAEMFGVPERNFKMIIYGKSTSGKSTLALQFASSLAKTIGKVLYNAFEEGHNKTISDTINKRELVHSRFYVADRMEYDELVLKIKKNHYRAAFIDSVKFMDFTYEQYKDLTKTYPKKSLIFIAHGDKLGTVEGMASSILKACDIKVYVEFGKAHVWSRYTGKTATFQLFKHSNNSAQGELPL